MAIRLWGQFEDDSDIHLNWLHPKYLQLAARKVTDNLYVVTQPEGLLLGKSSGKSSLMPDRVQ